MLTRFSPSLMNIRAQYFSSGMVEYTYSSQNRSFKRTQKNDTLGSGPKSYFSSMDQKVQSITGTTSPTRSEGTCMTAPYWVIFNRTDGDSRVLLATNDTVRLNGS